MSRLEKTKTRNHYQSAMASVPSLLIYKSAPLCHQTIISATAINDVSLQWNRYKRKWQH